MQSGDTTMTEAEFIKRIETALRTNDTPKAMARSMYNVCLAACKTWDMNPKFEVQLRNPTQNKAHGYGNCWAVSFEAGPYEWAVLSTLNTVNPQVLAEPHYSFDLQLYPKRVPAEVL